MESRMQDQIEGGISINEELGRENEKLRKALEFYRDGFERYKQHKHLPGYAWRPTETLLEDCGNIAKEALGE